MVKYNDILQSVTKLEQEKLSLELIDNIKNIRNEAFLIYLNYLKYGVNTEDDYEIINKRISALLFNKIKAFAPDLNQSAINNILKGLYSGYISFVDDIIVAGNTAIVVGNGAESDTKSSYLIGNNIAEITSSDFYSPGKNRDETLTEEVMKMFVTSISNYLSSFVCDGKFSCLEYDDRKLTYNVPKLNVYSSKTFDEICQMQKEESTEPIKILAKYNIDEICYLQIKIHHHCWVVKEYDEEVWKLSDNLVQNKTYVYK